MHSTIHLPDASSSANWLPDSPVTPSRTLGATQHQAMAENSKDNASNIMRTKANTADTKKFLEAYFGLKEEDVKHGFDHVVSRGLYNKENKRWKGLPKGNEIVVEATMYGHFAAIGEALQDSVRNAPGHIASNLLHCHWMHHADHSPDSLDPLSAPKVRPDVFCASAEAGQKEQQLLLLNDAEMEVKMQEASGGSSEQAKEKLRKAKQKLHAAKKTYWQQHHNTIELKPRKTEAVMWQGNTQAVMYGYEILREQLDRRFVFALTLCLDELRVWLCDRAGVLTTNTTINIHEDPLSFVRVMLAFSLLPAEQLGWDTTMRLYLPVDDTTKPSYLTDFKIEDFNGSVYNTHWAIEVPKPTDTAQVKKPEKETFITVKCISAVGANDSCGRATLIWEAIRWDERHDPNKKIYVLKQSWRPSDPEQGDTSVTSDASSGEAFSEAAIYERMQQLDDDDDDRRHVTDVYSSGDVEINGEIDDTARLIRRMLPCEPMPIINTTDSARLRSEGEEPRIYMVAVETASPLKPINREAIHVMHRTRSRVVMRTFGWPIKFFAELRELLRMLRDGLKGHRFSYTRVLTVHRDVSCGNLLICPKGTDVDETEGCLIDFDHAKVAHDSEQIHLQVDVPQTVHEVVNFNASRATPPMTIAYEVTQKVYSRLREISDLSELALAQTIVDYLTAHPFFRGTLNGWEMGWDMEVPLDRPVFTTRHARNSRRTGTFPFMSGEVLNAKRISDATEKSYGKKTFIHDAVHDVESFFWILVYLCLTRKGPGGHRRTELVPSPRKRLNDAQNRLIHVILCLFDGNENTLKANKALMLEDPTALETYIIPHISPYFNPLKDLIREWWTLILRAHRYHLVEYDRIHDLSITLLDSVIATLPQTPKEDKDRQEEIDRRQGDIDRIKGIFVTTANRSQTPENSGAPSTSWNTISPSTQRKMGPDEIAQLGRPDSPDRPVSLSEAALKKHKTDVDKVVRF